MWFSSSTQLRAGHVFVTMSVWQAGKLAVHHQFCFRIISPNPLGRSFSYCTHIIHLQEVHLCFWSQQILVKILFTAVNILSLCLCILIPERIFQIMRLIWTILTCGRSSKFLERSYGVTVLWLTLRSSWEQILLSSFLGYISDTNCQISAKLHPGDLQGLNNSHFV